MTMHQFVVLSKANLKSKAKVSGLPSEWCYIYMQHNKDSSVSTANCCPVHARQAVDQAWGEGHTKWASVQPDQKGGQHVAARKQHFAPYHA